MKSILVDALRQANGDDADKALSDSGSFDASGDEFDSPANDIIEGADEELELMSTTSALVVHSETEQAIEEALEVEEPAAPQRDLEIEYEPVDDEHAMTIAGMMPLPVTKRQAPELARFAPHLCLALALVVAASWLLINSLGVPGESLGTTIAASADSAEPPAVDLEPATRFPFLESGQPTDAGESAP